jgi:hypothetical protein
MTITPAASQAGTSTITIQVSDGSLTAQDSFDVVVHAGWYQEAYVKAANTGANDTFGFAVSVSGDTLAVGAYQEDSNQTTLTNGTTASTDNSAAESGAVYVYRRSGTTWAPEAYVKAANAEAGDQFGRSVSVSGDTLAVGAYAEDSNQTTITNGTGASTNNSAGLSGAVYVYRRSGVAWAQQAYVKAANAGGTDQFGWSVSVSGDTLAVGANQEDSNQTTLTNGTGASANNDASSSGAVYVYRYSGSTWAQEAYIKAANAGNLDNFGYSVSLSGDTLAVGADLEDANQTTITNGTTASADNSFSDLGAVYVYRRNGTTWAQEAYVKAANAGNWDNFGYSVSLSGDTLAVGAYKEDAYITAITNGTTASADNGAGDAGAVFVYRRNGTTWAQEAYIKAANANGSDQFGEAVSVSGDTLAVGAYLEDSTQTTITNGTTASANNSGTDSGAVYVYRRTGTTWAPEAYVKAANAEVNDYYGEAVSVSGDTLAVGSQYEDSSQTTITNGTTASANNSENNAGAVYVYRNQSRLFDPDVRVSAITSTSMTFAWAANLGSTTQIQVAPAASGTGTPAENCSDASTITLAAGTTSYTYSGLSPGIKYGFRFCAWDGTNASGGATIWETTTNTAPTIADVSNQITPTSTPLTGITVNIADAETTLTCGSLSATSSNTALLPVSAIVFTGTTPNCSMSLTPETGQSGTSTVTLSVSDGVLTTQETFTFNITPAITLDLAFASTLSLDSKVTFTRASSATYIDSNGTMQTAATNVARFDHHPVTKQSLGLLIEESRTNILPHSQNTAGTGWFLIGATASTDVATAPDGTLTADKLIEDSANTGHNIRQNSTVSVAIGTVITGSVYVKPAGRTQLIARFDDNVGAFTTGANGTFDLVAKSTTAGVGSPVLAISDAGNGWYRCSITATTQATGIVSLVIDTVSNGAQSYQGDGTSGLYLWGAQVEVGSFATSYIPTTTAAVTRAADVAIINGTNFTSFYNNPEGSVVAEGRTYNAAAATSSGWANHIFRFDDSTANNNNGFGAASSSSGTRAEFKISSTDATQVFRTRPTGGVTKASLGIKINNYNSYVDSLQSTNSAALSTPFTATLMSIGSAYDTSATPLGFWNGHISRILYWNTRLSDSLLQNLTQP